MTEEQMYDSTGLLTWSLSSFLEGIIIARQNRFAGCSVLELGCGLNPCTVKCLDYSAENAVRRIVLTDSNPEVLSVLKGKHKDSPKVSVARLDWDNFNLDESNCVTEFAPFDLVCASEVLYYRVDAKALFSSVSHLLSPKGAFMLVSAVRNFSLKDLQKASELFGLQMHIYDIGEVNRICLNGEYQVAGYNLFAIFDFPDCLNPRITDFTKFEIELKMAFEEEEREETYENVFSKSFLEY